MGYGYDLGTYSLAISTPSPEAQIWFDRGLNWTYGFNHEEAVACYRKALEHDPDCAMAYWGIAYAAGPNYNMPWHLYDERSRAEALATAFDATQEALARVEGLTPPEQALIRTLTARYPQRTLIDDMEPWNRAYVEVMRTALRAHPDHMDIRSVAVEAMMNLTPWLMWDLPNACPAEGALTLEAQALLEEVLNGQPGAMRHPGLLHLYVHLMEMSPFPEKALKAADVLRTLVPDAGHLVHMPTHIDVLCGNYHDVVHWNEAAIKADLKYYEREGALNFYMGYRLHDYHFVIYGALFLGQMQPALDAVQGMFDTVPEEALRIESPPMADYFEAYMAMKPHVLVPFGRWQEGIDAAALVPEARLLHNNTVRDLLEVAKAMLRGEIEYRKANYEVAFAELRRAVALEDNLPYDEPWGWMQPVRHALGALLFEQGHVTEAEQAYREDLGLGGQLSRATVHPDNVWSLKGLHDCLQKKGDSEELRQIKLRLDLALARADRAVGASCFCAQAAMKACCAAK